MIDVASTTTTFVASRAPNVTVAPLWKPLPVIVTRVPPEVGPVAGEMFVIVGAGSVYVNDCVSVAVVASEFVTVTSALPAAWAGAVAVIDVALATVTFVAETPPNFTVALLRKFAPLIVTTVPPAVLPDTGVMPLIVGAGLATAFTLKDPNMLLCPEPQSGMSQTKAKVPGVVAVN